MEAFPRECAAVVVVAVIVEGDSLVPELLVVPPVRPDHFAAVIFNLLTKQKAPHEICAERKRPRIQDSKPEEQSLHKIHFSLLCCFSLFHVLRSQAQAWLPDGYSQIFRLYA